MRTDFQTLTVWSIIRRFATGWVVAGGLLVVVSCVKHKDYIMTVFVNNTCAWVNAAMPIVIAVIGLGYIIKSVFK